MPDLNRVREALQSSMSSWATVEVQGEQARVVPAPDLDELTAHLEQFAPGWSLTWSCDATQPFIVRARLTLDNVSREGMAEGATLDDAKLAALTEMARLFGLSAGEGQWVEYNPEDGANVADLEGGAALASAGRAASLPPEPPRDPQMEKARRHIEELVEQIKLAGRSTEAMRILMRGYGETLEESRGIYKQLKAILEREDA